MSALGLRIIPTRLHGFTGIASSQCIRSRCLTFSPMRSSSENIDKAEDITASSRAHSTGVPEESICKISPHLTLHQADKISTALSPPNKPLVLLFQWLYAKPAHIQKYCALYRDLGMDVLAVRGKLSNFLLPPGGVRLSKELFAYLKESRPDDEKILIHAFSIGAYNYTIAMEEAEKNPEECANFRNRVIGQIFDSLVIGSYEHMSQGITEVLPRNPAFRRLILQTLNFYYNVTQKSTKQTYDKLVQHFKSKPIQVPTLLFYSENDPMCDTATLESMLNDWKSQKPGFDITKVSWPTSIHAAHLKEHNEDYVAAWKKLMEKLQVA